MKLYHSAKLQTSIKIKKKKLSEKNEKLIAISINPSITVPFQPNTPLKNQRTASYMLKAYIIHTSYTHI